MERLSQVLLLILAGGVIVALVKGGWTGNGGAVDWFRAKFLGQPAASPQAQAATLRAAAATIASGARFAGAPGGF